MERHRQGRRGQAPDHDRGRELALANLFSAREHLSTAGWMAGGLAIVCFALLFVFGRYPDQARVRLSAALSALPERLRLRVDDRSVGSAAQG